jgi:amino acid transporter
VDLIKVIFVFALIIWAFVYFNNEDNFNKNMVSPDFGKSKNKYKSVIAVGAILMLIYFLLSGSGCSVDLNEPEDFTY